MILYITESAFRRFAADNGVYKKVIWQTKALSQEGDETLLAAYQYRMAYLIKDGEIICKEFSESKKDYWNLVKKWTAEFGVSATYIRHQYTDKWFIDFLKWQKENGIKSIVEFPSWPYDGEITSKRALSDEYCFRPFIKDYISLVYSYSKFDTILDIPCKNIVNGIQIEDVPLRNPAPHEGINIIAVAGMAIWHGYERLITGLKDYYDRGGKEIITVFMVGTGGESGKYMSMTEATGLSERVLFYGKKKGAELNELFDKSDIAMGSLGMYKMDVTHASPLKGAEYCARGIPMVFGYEDMRFGNEPYVLKVENNSNPLNMDVLIDFYHRTKDDDKCSGQAIREYANDHMSWKSVMKPALDYLKG